MCLAVPGQLISQNDLEPLRRSGKVSFGGLIKEVSLAFVPAAGVGDYLLVHAGVAIAVVDPDEAARVLACIEQAQSQNAGSDLP